MFVNEGLGFVPLWLFVCLFVLLVGDLWRKMVKGKKREGNDGMKEEERMKGRETREMNM